MFAFLFSVFDSIKRVIIVTPSDVRVAIVVTRLFKVGKYYCDIKGARKKGTRNVKYGQNSTLKTCGGLGDCRQTSQCLKRQGQV